MDIVLDHDRRHHASVDRVVEDVVGVGRIGGQLCDALDPVTARQQIVRDEAGEIERLALSLTSFGPKLAFSSRAIRASKRSKAAACAAPRSTVARLAWTYTRKSEAWSRTCATVISRVSLAKPLKSMRSSPGVKSFIKSTL